MRRLIALLLCLAAPWALAAGSAQPEAASGFAPRPAASGRHFMAVTANPHATAAAVEMLRAGGTAMDAAIAAEMVLNVVEPQSSGIGGGGFLLHYRAADRSIRAYDGRETAPAAARPERFQKPDGEPLAFYDAVIGGRSVGVPGLLAMLELAHKEQGRLPWARLFQPAIRLAEQGFPVSPRLHRLIARDRFLARTPAARRLFHHPDGSALAVGETLRNPELAATFRLIARAGSQAFYQGPLARDLAAAVLAQPGGDLTPADLAAYRPRVRQAVCGPYRGYRVCGMPPPSSGGVTVLEILGLLSRYPRPGVGPLAPLAVHRFAEAGRLAYADRNRYLADPDFEDVPVAQLLDPAYLARRAALIDDAASLGQAEPGLLHDHAGQADGAPLELPSTSHLSIVDAKGNGVAMTSSIEDAFGSRLLVHGFLLNNELTDFAFRDRVDGRPVANRVAGGKRPLSSMAPTLVFDKQGRALRPAGLPRRQPHHQLRGPDPHRPAGLAPPPRPGRGPVPRRQPQRPHGTGTGHPGGGPGRTPGSPGRPSHPGRHDQRPAPDRAGGGPLDRRGRSQAGGNCPGGVNRRGGAGLGRQTPQVAFVDRRRLGWGEKHQGKWGTNYVGALGLNGLSGRQPQTLCAPAQLSILLRNR